MLNMVVAVFFLRLLLIAFELVSEDTISNSFIYSHIQPKTKKTSRKWSETDPICYITCVLCCKCAVCVTCVMCDCLPCVKDSQGQLSSGLFLLVFALVRALAFSTCPRIGCVRLRAGQSAGVGQTMRGEAKQGQSWKMSLICKQG